MNITNIATGICRKIQKSCAKFFEIDYVISDSDAKNDGSSSIWQRIYPTTFVAWPAPVQLGSAEVYFSTLPAYLPPQGVLLLNDGRLVGPHGLLFDAGQTHFHWHNWHRTSMHLPAVANSDWRNASSQTLPGTTLSLMSEYCARNYCHFLFDSLPRMHLFESSSFVDSAIDQYILPGKANERRAQTAERIGIPSDKIIWYGETSGLRCERLVSPTFPGVARCYPHWSIKYIRERFPTNVAEMPRRIYVTREGHDRNVANFQEIFLTLEKHDFYIFDPATREDATSVFANAELVIGPHGAGMADVAFCKTGTRVLELVPESNCHPYYFSIAVAAGCKYYSMLGRTIGSRSSRTGSRSTADFLVDPNEFRNAVELLVADKGDS